jgi:hypothetical protein
LFIVTWQLPVPEQSPDQPMKVDPASAIAVRETTVPGVNSAWQLAPQSIPAGLELTWPEPKPGLET